VRCEQERPLRVTGSINIGLHEEPIEFEFCDLHVAPNEFRRKCWFEPCALPLIGLCQCACGSVDGALRNTPKIDGLAIGKYVRRLQNFDFLRDVL
jgi:hypothetical protein